MNLTHQFTILASADAHNNALYTLSRNKKAQIKTVDIIFEYIAHDFKKKLVTNNFPHDPTSLNTHQ